MDNQLTYLVGLRFKMAGRLLKDLGRLRSLLMVVLCMLVLTQLIVRDSSNTQWVILIASCSVIGTIHFRRSDILFLRSVSAHYQYVLAVEYLLIISPFLLTLLYHKALSAGLLLVFFVLMLSFIYRRTNSRLTGRYSPGYPDFLISSYEWMAGLRKHKASIGLLLAAGFTGSYFSYVGALAAAFAVTAVVSSFYTLNEPRRFIILAADGPATFLLKKLGSGITLYSMCTLPVWAAVFGFYPELYLYTGLFWLANIILLVSIIIAKYVFYEDQKNMDLPLSTIFAAVGLLLIIPYLQMAVPLILIYFWMKAVRKLKSNVYAYA